jgi:hypothetical protein
VHGDIATHQPKQLGERLVETHGTTVEA